LAGSDVNTSGFLTYPVLQTADIVLYDAEGVPIGEDQKPHLEIAREIIRRFHFIYDTEIFKEPKEILTPTPRLLGIDGRKMSKSYGNSIYLLDSRDEVWEKLRKAKTDTKRERKTDPGNPEVCLVFDYHKEFSSPAMVEDVSAGCRAGKIGCIECKKRCLESIDNFLSPMRERAKNIDDDYIDNVIFEGDKKAREVAREKMEGVKKIVYNR
jgi:tryptophanyl-tRNA synthetase